MTPTIAVIGAGNWGFNIIRTCHELGALRLVADLNAERLAAVRRSFPTVHTTCDVGEVMRSKVEAVAIATDASTHFDLALHAIRQRKDVFVEKPLALNVADARALATTAELLKQKVFVGHLLLYHPAIIALRSAIADGKIGSIVHLRSRRLGPGRIRTNENVWWSFAPHDIAVMLALLGPPSAITAIQHVSVQAGIADFAYADFVFPADRTAHIEVSWLDPEKSSRIDVFGSAGVASVETARPEATLTLRTFRTSKPTFGTVPAHFGDAECTAFPHADALRDEMQSFLDWVGGGPMPPTDVEQGVRVVETLAATDAACRTQATSVKQQLATLL